MLVTATRSSLSSAHKICMQEGSEGGRGEATSAVGAEISRSLAPSCLAALKRARDAITIRQAHAPSLPLGSGRARGEPEQTWFGFTTFAAKVPLST